MLIQTHSASFGYGGRTVVHAEDLQLRAGCCVGIFGSNGSGKTTLVRGLTGLLPPMAGNIQRSGPLRIGYVPQARAMELHWPMTALDAAAMATSARRRFGWLGGGGSAVIDAMRALDVESLAHRSFATLSGGQQQRVLLAGALATGPQLLVLDEPTEGLDVRSRRLLLNTVRDRVAAGLGAVIISHDVEDLLYLCAQVAWLHPAESLDEPSRTEMIAPADLARRVTTVQEAT